MDITRSVEETKLELQIAPLIDVVFLLLIYFIMTASLIKKEGDISFMLPSTQPAPPTAQIPIEVLIEITAEGAVVLEGVRYGKNDTNLKELVTQLKGLKDIAQSQRSPFYVNILPNTDTEHQRVIDVMDACAAAKVKNLSFSQAM